MHIELLWLIPVIAVAAFVFFYCVIRAAKGGTPRKGERFVKRSRDV